MFISYHSYIVATTGGDGQPTSPNEEEQVKSGSAGKTIFPYTILLKVLVALDIAFMDSWVAMYQVFQFTRLLIDSQCGRNSSPLDP